MALAWVLTVLALAGVAVGVSLGQVRTLSTHIAAAGGGLLFGIALFWVIPEIAEVSGWTAAYLLPVLAGCGLITADWLLMHTKHSPRQGVIGPLLAATAVHSFLDGWSVRALSGQPLTNVAVTLGLALHKVPEGLALGWIARRASSSTRRAGLAAGAVELLTLAGAFIEPRANESGALKFGAWWTAGVLTVISGSFLFLGFHALWPSWRRPGVVVVFVTCLLLVGLAHHG
jgi:hypothetical protein